MLPREWLIEDIPDYYYSSDATCRENTAKKKDANPARSYDRVRIWAIDPDLGTDADLDADRDPGLGLFGLSWKYAKTAITDAIIPRIKLILFSIFSLI